MMPVNSEMGPLWLRHTVRGTLIGMLAGGAVGGVEAFLLLTTSRVARAALREAAVYAVVVDSLAVAVLSGLVAMVLALILGRRSGRGTERRLAASHVSSAAAFTLFAGGVLWLDRLSMTARASPAQPVPPLPVTLPALAGVALLGALLFYIVLGRHLVGWLLRHPRAVTAFMCAAIAGLLSILPVQVFTEARGYRVASATSLFSGQFPATHGVRAHMTDRLPESVPTLATLLHGAGYDTAGIAPWTSLKPAFSGLHHGFDTYLAAAVGEPPLLGYPLVQAAAGVFRRVEDQLWLGRAIRSLNPAEQALEENMDGRADVSTARALEWLALQPRTPFLLWVHYFDPHYPWTPPASYASRFDPGYVWSPDDVYDGSWRTYYAYAAGEWAPQPENVRHLRAMYAGEVAYADEEIGRLLSALEDAGLSATTLVVVTADHGESFGEHDEWLHGNGLYDHGLRVPLIIAGPGVPAGARFDQLARQVDVLPTILELLDLPDLAPPARIDGRSLVPVMQGSEGVQGIRSVAGAWDRTSFGQVFDDSILAVVTPDLWKLIVNYRKGSLELYYLPDDPLEFDNRASRDWPRVRVLFARLDAWAEEKGMAWLKRPEFRFGL